MSLEQEVCVLTVRLEDEVERVAHKGDQPKKQIDRQVLQHASDHDSGHSAPQRDPDRIEPHHRHDQIASARENEPDDRIDVPIVEPIGQADRRGDVAIDGEARCFQFVGHWVDFGPKLSNFNIGVRPAPAFKER